MNKMILAAALVAGMAAVAEAQVKVESAKQQQKNSTLRITRGDPYPYGFSGFGPGFVVPFAGGMLSYGHSLGYWPGYGYPYGGYGYGSLYGPGYGYSRYEGPLYPRPYTVTDHPPLPANPRGPADRAPGLSIDKAIEEGRRRFKSTDYFTAVSEFRKAVVADPSNGLALGWFALALAATRDYKNADKALRSDDPRLEVDAKSVFRDDKERERVFSEFSKVVGEGALAVAWVHALAGDPAKLQKLAEKDPAARKLLKK